MTQEILNKVCVLWLLLLFFTNIGAIKFHLRSYTKGRLLTVTSLHRLSCGRRNFEWFDIVSDIRLLRYLGSAHPLTPKMAEQINHALAC